MATFTLSEVVRAPLADVFAAFADFANAPARVTDIKRVEVLTPGPVGVGTKFKETRVVFKKEAAETFEVTAFEPDAGYELTARSCGAEYKTTFAFTPAAGGTRVEVEMTTRMVSLWAKLLTPMAWLMQGMMKRCLAKDLADARAAIERARRAA
jgi:hypothetical protein